MINTKMLLGKFANKANRTFSVSTLLTLFLTIAIAPTSSFAQGRSLADMPEKIAPITAPFEMPQLQRPVFPDRSFNIRDFGAAEMGANKTIKCTDAIHQAIEAAHKAGGGTVVIPRGNWLTGPIHMKNNINLHSEAGATIYFSEDKQDYLPVVLQRYEGVEAYNYSPLIYAFECHNVALTGKGIFEGQGEHWWKSSKTQPRAIATNVPLSKRQFGKGAGLEGMRPNFAVFFRCENVFIEGVTFNDGPMWNVHLVYTNKAVVRGVTVNSLKAGNGDGIVVDSSSDVLLEYNKLATGDDAIVIKSGFNKEGIDIDIPTENVVIRNYHAIDVRTGSGGVVFGSETSGGIRNVYVHNALFERCDRGIRFKTERGRGNAIENIYVRDIEMKDITYEAINFNTFYTGPGKIGPSPQVRNIDIRNIKIDGVPKAIVLIGLPEKWLEYITLENIDVKNTKEAIRLTRVKNLHMKNVTVQSDTRAMIAEDIYECVFDNITLKDNTKGKTLLIQGRHTGAVLMPGFPTKQIEFADGLNADILLKEMPVQTW